MWMECGQKHRTAAPVPMAVVVMVVMVVMGAW